MEAFLDPELIIPEEISHAVVIGCSRSRVFQTLTTAEGWNAWFTADSSLDARVGGRSSGSGRNGGLTGYPPEITVRFWNLYLTDTWFFPGTLTVRITLPRLKWYWKM
jgi:hypothetical protein